MWYQRVRSTYSRNVRKKELQKGESPESFDFPENRSWRLFQLTFILLNLPSVTNLNHPDRSHETDAVAEQFKAITGLDKDLYREIVWFRQEHLKELLDAAPRDRQRRLDELFGLSDYETAWTNTSMVQKEFTIEKQTLERDADVTGMERLQTKRAPHLSGYASLYSGNPADFFQAYSER
jgi:hypothetical protein